METLVHASIQNERRGIKSLHCFTEKERERERTIEHNQREKLRALARDFTRWGRMEEAEDEAYQREPTNTI